VAVWVPASALYLALAVLSAWRAAAFPATLRYGLGWWAMTFPLGMYAAASHDLGVATGSGALLAVAAVAFWIALAGWLAVAAGLLRQGARWVRSPAP
jgi:tellurite resistance protein TehA-like permease